MNTKQIIALALCATLAACTSGGSQQQTAQTQPATETAKPAADTAKQATITEQPQQTEPEQKKDEPQVDVAQNVLKLIDKKLLELNKNEFSITTAEYNQATTQQRTFDEDTSPLEIGIMHQSDCYYRASVRCYKMDEGDSYFVFFMTDAGCDGGATNLTRCYNYSNDQLTQIENPIKFPAFDEYFQGVNTTPFKEDLKWIKQDYPKPNKDLKSLDINYDNDGIIEIRPASTEISEELWAAIKPVKYKFDGKTLVKQ